MPTSPKSRFEIASADALGRRTLGCRLGLGADSRRRTFPLPPSPFGLRKAFTLTELLIVIAIIAVLSSLLLVAASAALRAGKRTSISLEIKQMAGAVETFKNDYGAYPPNLLNDNSHPKTPPAQTRDDLVRMFKKAFPRMDAQEQIVLRALAGESNPSNGNGNKVTQTNMVGGMNAEEALHFWLGGFSEDSQYPISGPGGPSFDANTSTNPQGEVLENRRGRYEFDVTRLLPRKADNTFGGRYIQYKITINGQEQDRRINLWEYAPKNSTKPFVYFDCSRYKPVQFDPSAEDLTSGDQDVAGVFAIKRLREGLKSYVDFTSLAFANAGKFQILHAGLDGEWGTNFGGSVSSNNGGGTQILFPEGPFIGPAADTLTNFTDGELADAQED
jgi:prepilin-type N-terminal cleavage/methylation domain-containing protein